MVGLVKEKTLLLIVLVAIATTTVNGAKDLKEPDAPAPAGAPITSKIKSGFQGAVDKVKGVTEEAKGAAAPLGSKIAGVAAPIGSKIAGAVTPMGEKLGLHTGAKGSGPACDVKALGAKGDGTTDDSKAFMEAWKKACGTTGPSTITVPKGEYLVDALEFFGPCKGQITMDINGNLKAPSKATHGKPHCGWIEFQKLEGFVLNGNGAVFDGQGAEAWKVNNCAKTGKCNTLPINIRFGHLTNSIIRNINSTNSKLFHINVNECKNFTLSCINIDAPAESLNTDGIHIGRSTGVNLQGGIIKTGDDCLSIGDGTQNLLVENIECGPGHGMSIGSLGKYPNEQPVANITVRKVLIKNTDNGVRIKTWPGSPPSVASHIHFDDITMDNVSLPILIDQVYCPHGKCKAGEPSRVKLSDVSFTNIRGTSASKIAVKLLGSTGVHCQNITLGDIDLVHNGKEGPAVSACANVKPNVLGKMIPAACTEVAKADPS